MTCPTCRASHLQGPFRLTAPGQHGSTAIVRCPNCWSVFPVANLISAARPGW